MEAFESNQIKRLILWDKLEYIRIEAIENSKGKQDESSETQIFYLKEITFEFTQKYLIVEQTPLLDWFIDNVDTSLPNSPEIFIVSNNTQEGNQFVKSFNGIGSILQYGVQTIYEEDFENEGDQFNDDEFI